VSSQQLPHVGRRHRAHGPAAIAPQCEQRALGGSPADISEVTATMFAHRRQRRGKPPRYFSAAISPDDRLVAAISARPASTPVLSTRMALFIARWPDGSAWIVDAESMSNVAEILDEIDACRSPPRAWQRKRATIAA
jgi:hypothetical protein